MTDQRPGQREPNLQKRAAQRQNFATTQWSVVLAAGAKTDNGDEALANLCEVYWRPLYAFVRRRGFQESDALDLTQGFFAQLLDKDSIAAADPNRGRFRSFLLASINNFLANEKDRRHAKKRGGERLPFSLDTGKTDSAISLEPVHELTPQSLFQRQWVSALLGVVMQRIEAEYESAGKGRQFALLQGSLSAKEAFSSAEKMGITLVNARQMAHRLKKRYREVLREEVARTVDDPSEVDSELQSLFEIFR